MFSTRMLLLFLLASLASNDVMGQDFMEGFRQRLQNRDMGNRCDCGASYQSECTCQDCGRAPAANYYPAPSAVPSTGSYPATGAMPGMQPGAMPGMQPGAMPGMQPGAMPGMQPGAMPGMQPGAMSGMQPGAMSGMQPGAQPVPNAMDPNATTNPGNVIPGDFSGNGNLAPPAAGGQGQEAGNDFDLSTQFAGQGEASGVSDLTIGDFFSGSGAVVTGVGAPISNPIAGGDRRRKVSDHFSPIPVNRTFFSYHGFGDAVTDVNGNQADVQRFTFGLERTFWNNNASFEIRIPFVHGLNSQQTQDFSTSAATGTEFGNITVASKYLLIRRQKLSISAGVASVLPTAGDAAIDAGATQLAIQNEATDIIPYLAYHFRPNQNSWATFTTQLDFNIRGNEFIADPGTSFEQTGRFNDQNLFSIDISTGRWLWRDQCCKNRMMRGIAGIFELHYTTTMNDTDELDLGSSTITNPFNRVDTLNSTVGFRMQLRDRTFATVAAIMPLRTGEDRPFETELNFNISRLY